jgi:hypothetical protein
MGEVASAPDHAAAVAEAAGMTWSPWQVGSAADGADGVRVGTRLIATPEEIVGELELGGQMVPVARLSAIAPARRSSGDIEGSR